MKDLFGEEIEIKQVKKQVIYEANEKEYTYTNPLKLTQQFRFCGNPLSCDFYRNCSFQCNYCFAKNHVVNEEFNKKIEMADFKIVKRLFEKAFDSDEKSNNILIELLRNKTPIHCGGMSDPFQPVEFKKHLTYKLIEISNKYNVPVIFSTKQCYLPDEYFSILNPKLHAFQISLISDDAEFIKKYEPNTPTPEQRINFMKKLKSKGFWVAMRVQPLIDVNQALNVMKKVENIVNYITVEHLKIAMNSSYQQELFKEYMPLYTTNKYSRYFEKETPLKEKEILFLQQNIKGCKIGVGDNDLHHLSQSRCCCGVDTIGGLFDNYLKYNITYFSTNDDKPIDDNIYIPKGDCSGCFMSQTVIKGVKSFKDYVDLYCAKNLSFLKNKALHEKYYNFFNNSENITKFEKNIEARNQTNIFDFMADENE